MAIATKLCGTADTQPGLIASMHVSQKTIVHVAVTTEGYLELMSDRAAGKVCAISLLDAVRALAKEHVATVYFEYRGMRVIEAGVGVFSGKYAKYID